MGVFDGIGDVIGDGLGAAGDVLESGGGLAVDVVRSAGGMAGDVLESGGGLVVDVVGSAGGMAGDVLDHAAGFAVGGLAGPLGALAGGAVGLSGIFDAGKQVMGGFAGIFGGAIGGDSDVKPAWEEDQPAWADSLIAMCVALDKWPEASETALWQLTDSYTDMAELLNTGEAKLNTARGAIRDGWDAPAAEVFDDRATENSDDLGTDAQRAENLAAKADEYATETQRTKLAINVAFRVTLEEVYTAVLAAFLTGGDPGWDSIIPMVKLRAEIEDLVNNLATTAGHPVARAGG